MSYVWDTIGILGTVLIVGTYLLLQSNKISAKSLSYNLCNLVGSVLLLISLCFNFNLASFIIECFWILASLIGLYNYFKTRHNSKETSSTNL